MRRRGVLYLVLALWVCSAVGAAEPKVYTQWPFDGAEAKRRQVETAKAMGAEVERDIEIAPGVTMRMVLIPAGEFIMGSAVSVDETARLLGIDRSRTSSIRTEHPQHRVRITQPFWMGKYEVTQDQWVAVMGSNPSRFKGQRNPVDSVSWRDMHVFRRKVNAHLRGGTVTLPTEAQWEYACRAGTSTPFHFGETMSTEQANCNGKAKYGDSPKGIYRGKTVPVGTFPGNAWGLHNMHGNVREQCSDLNDARYYARSPIDDPRNEADNSGQIRSLRGGCYLYGPGASRSADRSSHSTTSRLDRHGFRVVMPAEAPPDEIPADPWETYTQWPFNATEAKRRQTETAKALGVGGERDLEVAPGVTMRFVLIPAGEFVMGSPAGEKDRHAREELHRVRISRPFWLGKHEVTNAQWKAVIGRTWSEFEGSANPVDRVSWYDVQSFLQEVNKRVRGEAVALPTEAQWEYACRAGSALAFGTGNIPERMNDYAWWAGNAQRRPHPVGQKEPNPWGLHDMHGNVWEWCNDWYGHDYYWESPLNDPAGPGEGRFRVLRGGASDVPGHYCRSAAHERFEPRERGDSCGFRVALFTGLESRLDAALRAGDVTSDGHRRFDEAKARYDEYLRKLRDDVLDRQRTASPMSKAIWERIIDSSTAQMKEAAPQAAESIAGAIQTWSSAYEELAKEIPVTSRKMRVLRQRIDALHNRLRNLLHHLEPAKAQQIIRAVDIPLHTWPFSAAEARLRQELAASSLGSDVERDIELAGGVKMRMVLIPAGDFVIAGPGGEGQKPIAMDEPFWMSKCEVTQAQWEAVMGANPSKFRGPDNPVERVSWNDTQRFLKQANAERQDTVLALPSDVQWEFACRAGSPATYCFGGDDETLREYGWYTSNSGGHTHAVGRKEPNAWGLHDMHGNVNEWCASPYAQAPDGSELKREDTEAELRVMRGGSWAGPPHACRAARRDGRPPTTARDDCGFRVVLMPKPAAEETEADERKTELDLSDAAAGKWVSLYDGKTLDGWRVPTEGFFKNAGEVNVVEGRVLLAAGQPGTGIAVTGRLPIEEYEFSVEATRMDGRTGFCSILFPLGTSHCMLAVGGYGGKTLGLQSVDGRGANNNPTTRKIDFQQGRWYQVRLRVTKERVEAWVDDERMFSIDRARHEFGVFAGYESLKPLGIFSWTATGALRNIRMRRLGPDTSASPPTPGTE